MLRWMHGSYAMMEKILMAFDRYVFIGQCFDQEKVSTPLQVKSFQKETSVTSAALFNSVIETIDKPLLSRVYSSMADTTAVNTGKKSGVNKRLEEYLSPTLDTKFTPSNAYFILTKSILLTLKTF